jgi:ferric-dicitrate binding protein FerR (iron transport regulator)
MNLENENMDDLITDYLSKGLERDERRRLKTWMEESDDHRWHFLQMREVWFSSAGAGEDARFDKDRAFRRFIRQIAVEKRGSLCYLRRAVRYAAILLCAASVAAASYYLGSEKVKSRFADIVMEAPAGSRSKLLLPDGTSVWLNAGSKLTYSQGFGVSDRKISLTGEGYFEVVKNEKLPFRVSTNELCVDVLGTKFNFRNYPDDREAWVALLEGSIGLEDRVNRGTYHYLKPNGKATLDKDSKKLTISSLQAHKTSRWVDGHLFFDEELLPDIVRELERSYHVNITIADESLKDFRFYGDFERTSLTIEEVMKLLCATGKMTYTVTDKTIVLKTK